MWCIHNAMKLEKAGLSTTTICTSNFSFVIKATASAKGFPDIALVTLPHPIAENDDDIIREKADDNIEELMQILTTPTEKLSE
ncbi:hypothetical protein ACFL7M_15690 [Thermodesulfobacteriota bacterium]